MEPQSPRAPRMPSAPRAPRNGAKAGAEAEETRYAAEESAKGLIAGLVGLDRADIIRRSNRVQEILDDFSQHAPKEEVSLEQLKAEGEKVDAELDQLEQTLDERAQSRRKKQNQGGYPPQPPREKKPRVPRVKNPRFTPLFQNEPEEKDTSKGWEPEL